MKLTPVTLEGSIVRLEPLSRDHLEGLIAVGLDPDLWRLTMSRGRTAEEMRAYVEQALEEQRAGVALPFATVERSTNRVIGSTRFGNISTVHKRVEIGWTWVARPWQRTGVNTEAKFLMLRHAFEEWKCIRVELKTSVLNERSRNAILRIGAKEEGILRQHMITPDGTYRDTMYFSIIDKEWPPARQRLLEMMAAYGVTA